MMGRSADGALYVDDAPMDTKPIEVFETQQKLAECLEWWKDRLFLTDWIIKAKVCPPEDFIGKEKMGENEFDMVNRCCVIRILDQKYYGDRIMVYCAEKILVHELLHCKYNWIYNDNIYEGKYVDTVEHGLLEQMAKSLIMAKYNLDLEYFIN